VGADPRRPLTGLLEALIGELADGLQQPVSRRPPGVLGLYQRLVDQAAQQVDHVQAVAATDLLHRLQRHAARKHGKAPEQDPFVVVEQVVAPGQRGVQCLLAGDGGAAASAQDMQGVVEA
jgi:hypothetical protein